jgi:hypothetical protein
MPMGHTHRLLQIVLCALLIGISVSAAPAAPHKLVIKDLWERMDRGHRALDTQLPQSSSPEPSSEIGAARRLSD